MVDTDDSNPPPQTIHLKLGLFFIKSMIFSVAVGGFIGGPMPVFLACLRALGEGLFCPLLRVPPLELHMFTDLRWTPTASTNSVTSAHLLFFFALVIKLLCFALRTSFFLRNLLKWFFRPRTSCYFFLFWMWQPILSS